MVRLAADRNLGSARIWGKPGVTDAFPDAWGLYSNHRFHQSFTRDPPIGTVPDDRDDNDRLVEVYLRFLVLGATASSGVVAYKGVCAPL